MEMAENSRVVMTCEDFQDGFELGQERIYTKIKQSMLYTVYGNRTVFLEEYLNNWELDELYLEAAELSGNEEAFYFGYGLGLSAGYAEVAINLYVGAVAAGNALSAGAASMSGGSMAMQTTAGTVVVVGGDAAVAEGAIVLYPTLPNVSYSSSDKGDSEADLGDYKFKEGIDEDLRGGKGTFKEALDKAFEKTGTPKEDFEVTKWGRDQYGKSHPVEWRAPNGAEVSIDIGHPVESGAPTADHVGWQTGGKRGSGGGVRGHIFVDEVPYNR